MRLVLKDAYSIRKLREIFARIGLPKMVLSDNGPQFISQKFADFYREKVLHQVYSRLTIKKQME